MITPFLTWLNGQASTITGATIATQINGTKDGRGILTLLGGIACIVLWLVGRASEPNKANLGLAIAFCSIAFVTFFFVASADGGVRSGSFAHYALGGIANATVGGGLILAFFADLTALTIGILLIIWEARLSRARSLRPQSPLGVVTDVRCEAPRPRGPDQPFDDGHVRDDHPLTASGSAFCLACNAPLPPTGVFCAKCGSRVVRQPLQRPDMCRICNAPLSSVGAYCGNCGSPVMAKS